MGRIAARSKELLRTDERTQRLIRKYLEKWVDPAGFGHWTISVEWELDRSKSRRDNAAEVDCSWEYLDATITFYLTAMRGLTESEIETTVVHELCHLLTEPIADYSDDDKRLLSERVTTDVAKAMLWTDRFVRTRRKPAGMKETKKP